jgi:SAM-dependent methyltransferase
MRTDVQHLREFYRSPLGQIACRRLRDRVRVRWPNVRGMRVVGVGYAVPLLRPFLEEAERVAALMPASQGVHRWPASEPNLTAQVEEVDWPISDSLADRLILMHALETVEELRLFLRECWRLLAPGGRLLVIAPNRRGLWALRDRIPFGHGRPYTGRQLRKVLQDNLFEPLDTEYALHLPPALSNSLLRVVAPLEPLAARRLRRFGGVVIVEAEKSMGGAVPATAHVRRYLPEAAARTVPGTARQKKSPNAR